MLLISVRVRVELERNAKWSGSGGLMGTISFRTPWLFLSKQEKYKFGVRKLLHQVRAAVTGRCHCPGVMQGEKDLATSLLPGRGFVHPSPYVSVGSRAQEASRCALCQQKEEVPPSVHTRKEGTKLRSPTPWSFRAALNPPNSLHKSRIQHTWRYTLLKGITMHVLYGIQHYQRIIERFGLEITSKVI